MPVRLSPLGRARKPAAARAGLLGHDPFILEVFYLLEFYDKVVLIYVEK